MAKVLGSSRRSQKKAAQSSVIYVEQAEFDRLMKPSRRTDGDALRRTVQASRAAAARG